MRSVDPYFSPESRFHLFVLRAGHVLERGLTQALAPIGLSTAQFYILLQLNRRARALTPKQIGSALLVERTNLTLILDRMERDGLVQRERNPNDRRSVLISMTDRGGEMVRAGLAIYEETFPQIFEGLALDDIQQAVRILSKFTDSAAIAAEPVGRQA